MLFPCFNSVPEKALMEMVDKMYLKKKKRKSVCVWGVSSQEILSLDTKSST